MAIFRAYHFPDRNKSDEADEGSGNNSIWAVIGGFLKNYPNYTERYVLYEMSYANLIMYSSVLPSYDYSKNDKKNSTKSKRSSSKDGLSFGSFLTKMKGLQK